MRRWRVAALAVLTLLIWYPAVRLGLSLGVSSALGCEVHEGFAQPCPWRGMDLGPWLYEGFVFGWFLLLTGIPMLLSIPAWLIWGVRGWRAR